GACCGCSIGSPPPLTWPYCSTWAPRNRTRANATIPSSTCEGGGSRIAPCSPGCGAPWSSRTTTSTPPSRRSPDWWTSGWLLEGLAVTPHRQTLAHRLAGSTVYGVLGADLVLDIRHGRLGHAGQHAAYVTRLFRTRRAVTLGGLVCACPAPEDQLVLQGVEK